MLSVLGHLIGGKIIISDRLPKRFRASAGIIDEKEKFAEVGADTKVAVEVGLQPWGHIFVL